MNANLTYNILIFGFLHSLIIDSFCQRYDVGGCNDIVEASYKNRKHVYIEHT